MHATGDYSIVDLTEQFSVFPSDRVPRPPTWTALADTLTFSSFGPPSPLYPPDLSQLLRLPEHPTVTLLFTVTIAPIRP